MRLSNSPRDVFSLLFMILISIPSTLSAKTPTSFCKCICAGNSTIIPLDSPSSSTGASSGSSVGSSSRSRLSLRKFHVFQPRDDSSPSSSTSSTSSSTATSSPTSPPSKKKRNCSTCNRSFCLSYNLPICASVPEQEIFTTCFQRDSVKDQLVVLIFIGATAALLGWAAVRPWVEKVKNRTGGVGGGAGYEGIGGGIHGDERGRDRRGNGD